MVDWNRVAINILATKYPGRVNLSSLQPVAALELCSWCGGEIYPEGSGAHDDTGLIACFLCADEYMADRGCENE